MKKIKKSKNRKNQGGKHRKKNLRKMKNSTFFSKTYFFEFLFFLSFFPIFFSLRCCNFFLRKDFFKFSKVLKSSRWIREVFLRIPARSLHPKKAAGVTFIWFSIWACRRQKVKIIFVY